MRLPSSLPWPFLPPPVERFARSLCAAGLILGTLLFAVSLTPSLVPRTFGLQGILSGLALGAGYGLGVFGRWLWTWLELPAVRGRWREAAKLVLGLLCAGVALAFLWQASAWQNSVHERFSLPPVQTSRPFTVGLIAAAVFAVLLLVARGFGALTRWMAGHLGRVVPWRLSVLVALCLSLFLAWTLANGVLARAVFDAFDTSWARLDAYIEDEVAQPGAPHLTGSAASLVAWRDLGRQGRRFVTGAAAPQAIAAVTGRPAQAPLRVYVGLNSAQGIEQRVALALAELKRVGGFQRAVLAVITPTGTGLVDPGALRSLEHLHHGDVASVAVQYSYLPSWLTLMALPEHGTDTARALFRAVYGHWRTLPREQRPRLVLHGLSLGALHSERSADLWDIISDPPHGALWSGPPFRSALWQWVTTHRNPDSPAWQPRFRDGAVIRFTLDPAVRRP